jgi:hypothetical protein
MSGNYELRITNDEWRRGSATVGWFDVEWLVG